jgi:hypothetical protein
MYVWLEQKRIQKWLMGGIQINNYFLIFNKYMFVILLSKTIFIFPLMCRYVHHVIKVEAKAEEFASKIKNQLKLTFPKTMEDAKCRKTRFNIKNNRGHVVERSPFTTFIFI